jgi:hypothetical protein
MFLLLPRLVTRSLPSPPSVLLLNDLELLLNDLREGKKRSSASSALRFGAEDNFQVLGPKKANRIEHDTKVEWHGNFTCADCCRNTSQTVSLRTQTVFTRLFPEVEIILSSASKTLSCDSKKNEISTSSSRHTRHYNQTPYIKLSSEHFNKTYNNIQSG